MARRDPPFHNPFVEAAGALRRAVAARPTAAVPPPAPPPAGSHPPEPMTEERAFRQAMAGVQPLARAEPRVAKIVPAAPRPSADPAEGEVMACLADLVAGTGSFDIADTPEYVEGLAPGVDRRLVRRLRRGDFAMQGHLDLHGRTREEARTEVEQFLAASQLAGQRAILLVHGRGLNSEGHIPVLKQALVEWLSRGRLARRVLAFATARPVDGGGGAMYVLLRRGGAPPP